MKLKFMNEEGIILENYQRDHLRAVRLKSGVTLEVALQGRKYEGLSSASVTHWLRTPSARVTPQHYDIAVKAFEGAIERGGDWIVITKEMKDKLRDLRMRSGVTIEKAMCGHTQEGLSSVAMGTWLNPKRKLVRQGLYDLAVQYFEASISEQEFIEITPGLIEELRALRRATKTGVFQLVKRAQDIPPDFDLNIVQRWMSAHTKSARKDHVEFVLSAWKNVIVEMQSEEELLAEITTAAKATQKRKLQQKVISSKSNTGQKSGQITPEILKELRELRLLTGVEPQALLHFSQNVPHNLIASRVENWLKGLLREADAEHLEFVLEEYRKHSQNKSAVVSSSKVRPLSPSGEELTERPSCDSIVPLDYEQYYSQNIGQYVDIHPAVMQELQTLKLSTGVGPYDILKKIQNLPKDLTGKVVVSWLYSSNAIANKDHLDFVLNIWRVLPQYEWTEITDEIQQQIINYEEQSGFGASAMLRGTSKDKPSDLTSVMIRRWKNGTKKLVRQDHVDYVLQRWQSLIDADQYMIELTENMIEALTFHRERTKLSHQKLITRSEVTPKGLNVQHIDHWMQGKHARCLKNYYEFVLRTWKEAPDYVPGKKIIKRNRPNPHKVAETIREKEKKYQTEMSVQNMAQLKQFQKLGWLPGFIFKGADNIPEGLDTYMVSSWLAREPDFVKKEYLEYVLGKCEELQRNAAGV